jgi:hypothetical protein
LFPPKAIGRRLLNDLKLANSLVNSPLEVIELPQGFFLTKFQLSQRFGRVFDDSQHLAAQGGDDSSLNSIGRLST